MSTGIYPADCLPGHVPGHCARWITWNVSVVQLARLIGLEAESRETKQHIVAGIDGTGGRLRMEWKCAAIGQVS